eukprot:TRINITY_DN4977_c0_g1_i2.p1 TRINITY_DN4977_c0_g1~~TRINITY_DN4977_c0_g1_i2.p1  ORF type:complete len:327 (-),score=101.00 TRINITY_DN4977_c0_g1_i2:90-1070(-)
MMTESSSTHTTYLDDLKAETLRKFQADTGEMDPQRAIQVLDDCDWDLNASITSYRSGISRNAAPVQPASGGWLSYFWNFGYGFLSAFLPSQTDVDPAVAASRFLSEFERQYDAVHPTFLEMSFQNACKRAKEEFKFLVVYLHSSLHQHTDQFCRETLSTDLIAEFVNENFLFWAGSVTYPEAYKTSLLLGASTYPFIAVVCNNSVGGLTICDRIEEGLIDSERLMMRLSGALEQFGPTLLAAKLEYEERNQSRLIREEQDRAFTESLREDEAKQQRLLEQERRQREEQEATEKEERARLRKAEEKQRTKEEIRKNLPGLNSLTEQS